MVKALSLMIYMIFIYYDTLLGAKSVRQHYNDSQLSFIKAVDNNIYKAAKLFPQYFFKERSKFKRQINLVAPTTT